MQQLCEGGDSLPPPYPWRTEVNRARPSVPSHTGSLQPKWSCCVSVKDHDVRATSSSGKIVLFQYRLVPKGFFTIRQENEVSPQPLFPRLMSPTWEGVGCPLEKLLFP